VPRKAHVYRIFQTDDQGNVVDPDVWLDVLRIDRMTISEPRGASSEVDHLQREYLFLWGDDTIPSWAVPPRKLHKYTVSQPPPDSSNGGAPASPDPSAPSVDIPLIERTNMNFRGPQDTGLEGDTHATVFWVFINDGRGRRKETPIRVTNNDLNNEIKMPVPKAGDPQPPTDPTVKDGGGIQWADYAKALQDGTKDDSQFVDVLVTQRFDARLPPPSFAGQMVTYVLVQKQQGGDPNPGVLDLFNAPPGAGTESGTQGNVYRTDPLQTIVNVSWGGLTFLYSGGDGMFGSKDGKTWTALANSVPAIGVAWIDNVWVAVGQDGSAWTSTDGAQTWQASAGIAGLAPPQQVVAMRPAGDDGSGAKKQGVFATWGVDAAGENSLVYISNDLGQSWNLALTLPTSFGDTGYEQGQSLSAGGGALFFSTTYGVNRTDNGNGRFYVCTDGAGFDGGVNVFGPSSVGDGTVNPFPRQGYFPAAAAYDQSTGTYTALGLGQLDDGHGTIAWDALFVTSDSPFFSEGGASFYSTTQGASSGTHIALYTGAGAGGGACVTVLPLVGVGPSTPCSFVAMDTTGGASDLFTDELTSFGFSTGPVCFKSNGLKPGEAVVTPPSDPTKTDATAMFACVAYSPDGAGGVYTQVAGEGFTRTHAGSPILTDVGGMALAGLAVGRVATS
jgi:hypothetical protein